MKPFMRHWDYLSTFLSLLLPKEHEPLPIQSQVESEWNGYWYSFCSGFRPIFCSTFSFFWGITCLHDCSGFVMPMVNCWLATHRSEVLISSPTGRVMVNGLTRISHDTPYSKNLQMAQTTVQCGTPYVLPVLDSSILDPWRPLAAWATNNKQ
jgi:hypothetical protein